MKHWPETVLVLLGVAALGLLLATPQRNRRLAEPCYQGKALSFWAGQTWVQDRLGRNAIAAIRAIGPKAAPFLLDELKGDDPWFRRLYVKTWSGLPAFLQPMFRPPNSGGDNPQIPHVSFNLRVLGLAAVPELVVALSDRHANVRLASLWTLLDLNQEGAVGPVITPLLNDPNAEVRICAALALARAHPDNTNSVALLIEGLKGAGVRVIMVDEIRMQAADVLGRMGPKAQKAVPELQRAFKFFGFPAMRTATSVALWRITPDTNSALLVMGELKNAFKDGSVESYNTCDKILTAFAEVGGPPEATPIILGIVESAEVLQELTRSNLIQHGRQVLNKFDPETILKIRGDTRLITDKTTRQMKTAVPGR